MIYKKYIKFVDFNDLYYLFIRVLIGKLIKKGKKKKAINLYNMLKEKIKIETKKKRSFFYFFIIFLTYYA